MITSMNQTLSEAFVYAESQGIAPALFHQAVNSALFQSQLYENYGKTILNPPQHPGATVSLGIKDTRLVREAAAEAGSTCGLPTTSPTCSIEPRKPDSPTRTGP